MKVSEEELFAGAGLGIIFVIGFILGLILHPTIYKEKHDELMNIQTYEHIIDALHNDVCAYIDSLNMYDPNMWRVQTRLVGQCNNSTDTTTQQEQQFN